MLCEIFALQASQKGIEIKCSFEASLKPPKGVGNPLSFFQLIQQQSKSILGNRLPKVLGDVRRFQQVIINLLKNAYKFTKEGHIHLKASYDHSIGSIIVHVQDTGSGIAKEDMPKLF